MRIRKAEQKDIPAIAVLLKEVNRLHHQGRPDLFQKGAQKYTERELTAIFQQEDKPVFVGVDDQDQVLGYIFCWIEQPESAVLTSIKTLYVDDLCVAAKHRHQHLGRQLLEHAAAYAKTIGCYNMTLNVWCCNEEALQFYQACGLQPQKIKMERILK